MNRFLTCLAAVAAYTVSFQAVADDTGYWAQYGAMDQYSNPVVTFDTGGEGVSLPILWGFDTAWNSVDNMVRGVRHAGSENVSLARVSFQTSAAVSTSWLTGKVSLPNSLKRNLSSRLTTVEKIGHKVDIAINLDGVNTLRSTYGGVNDKKQFTMNIETAAQNYAKVIYATLEEIQNNGYNVVTVSPLNEPDYLPNETPVKLFDLINKELRNESKYPKMKGIRLSGGNTLNCDSAMKWYDALKVNLEEGNTHQLAGDFDHYADFFKQVRADGKYATADELHNVMEAMVGVEYGMQTGIWWADACKARGDFMKASGGQRLGYAENRNAWSAASVYRRPDGLVQGFLGCSERQAKPSTFIFASNKSDFFVNGVGPMREYVAKIPGDERGAYQSDNQKNAECVFDIETGEDIRPEVNGDYSIANVGTYKVLSTSNGSTSNGTEIVQKAFSGSKDQYWSVTPVPITVGGDFSYWFIRNSTDNQAVDDNGWSMNPGSNVIVYTPSGETVQQWTLEYAGGGNYRIRNKNSGLYLQVDNNSDNTKILQQEYAETQNQLWRFVKKGVMPTFTKPKTPTKPTVTVSSVTATIKFSTASGTTTTILRKDGDNDYNVIARGLISGEHTDRGLVAGQTHCYKIMAEDTSGNRSDMSDEVVAECADGGLVAHFPLTEHSDDISGNGFSIRTPFSASFRGVSSRKVGTRMTKAQALQLPYNLLQSKQFSVLFEVNPETVDNNSYFFRTGMHQGEAITLHADGADRLTLEGTDGSTCRATGLSNNEWKHIAVTYDGDKALLYLDGEVGDGAVTEIPTDRVLSYIGKGFDATSGFVGDVSNVKVYSKALTPQEIKNDFAIATSVSDLTESNEIVRTEYFSADGMRLTEPSVSGVTVVIETYTDGTRKISKISGFHR